MMLLAQGFPKQTCTLLAVPCYRFPNDAQPLYPFPELISSGRLEIHILMDPSLDEFQNVLESTGPNVVYLQGEHVPNEEELGGLVWKGVDLSNVDAMVDVFGSTLPTTVYLEFPNGQKLAEALHSKGIPYVIYWKSSFSIYAACHFRQALFSVIQSSLSHTWDAFQLAYASFRLHCEKNNSVVSANGQTGSNYPRPYLLGECPKIEIAPPYKEPGDEEVSETNPSIKIHDEDANLRFLVCGEPCTMSDCLLEPLEDGLNALLCIEIRGSKLHNRVSAPTPPLQAGTYSRGVVTMRCDLLTSSSTHISLLVSGSAQTCFDDQLLETYIKNELIENSQLVHALPNSETHKFYLPEPRRSASVACGATVFEVDIKVPTWASQILRQLAPELSYRSLVSLGIACIQGCPVASFEKEDAKRLLYFSVTQEKANCQENIPPFSPPLWFKPPTPCRTVIDKSRDTHDSGPIVSRVVKSKKFSRTSTIDQENKDLPISQPSIRKMKIAAMRPVPRMRQQKLLPFSGSHEVNNGLDANLTKTFLPVAPTVKHNVMPCGPTHRKNQSNSLNSQQIISLNPLPLKKHGCGRPPIPVCSEEEFLRDVMQFLILRGHTRLIPQGGLAEFPEAILNAKRLDLYNLYREVVSRGGFHVGNGINWKGQVFSKMRNHTLTNRMTGVGNTLKRHYETYLLEYELAHDDVDGECCLLCHSSAAGDWVNCSVCDEWAHFGCDRRQGLGAFKDYAKTDGLEYICPHCSVTNLKKKTHKASNGLPVSNIRNA